jgi:predicted membrane protein
MLVDSTQTTIFFWSYVAIIYFVVFNIALAVILEVYSDIRKENQSYFRRKKRISQQEPLPGRNKREEGEGSEEEKDGDGEEGQKIKNH